MGTSRVQTPMPEMALHVNAFPLWAQQRAEAAHRLASSRGQREGRLNGLAPGSVLMPVVPFLLTTASGVVAQPHCLNMGLVEHVVRRHLTSAPDGWLQIAVLAEALLDLGTRARPPSGAPTAPGSSLPRRPGVVAFSRQRVIPPRCSLRAWLQCAGYRIPMRTIWQRFERLPSLCDWPATRS